MTLPGALVEVSLQRGSVTSLIASRKSGGWLGRAILWCLFADVVIGAFVAGVAVRRYAWDRTEAIRYTDDIDNAFFQGTEATRTGLLDYDDLAVESTPPGLPVSTDYAPGRLTIAVVWSRWVLSRIGGTSYDPPPSEVTPFYQTARDLGRAYEFCSPLLTLNLLAELAAAVGMFVLVKRWTSYRGTLGSTVSGLVAALLVWFNPAVIWDAHCWPQWDAWLLPFYIWAVVAASADAWFVAGCLIGVGAMFKAQVLLGAPVLLAWPAARGRVGALARLVSGLACAVAACASPWLVRVDHRTNPQAVAWVAGTVVAAVVLLPTARRWRTVKGWAGRVGEPTSVLLAVSAMLWPLAMLGWRSLLEGTVAIGALWLALRGRAGRYAIPTAVAAALFACVPVFGGSMAWFQAGVMAGARQASEVLSLPACANLPTLLAVQWHWQATDPVAIVPAGRIADAVGWLLAAIDPAYEHSPGGDAPLPIRVTLTVAYVAAVVCCGLVAGRRAAAGSPRLLVAVGAAPWVLLFTLLPQMHERYLIWGAALASAAAVLSIQFAVLYVVVTLVALVQQVSLMAPGSDLLVARLAAGCMPGIGFALLVAAILYACGMATPDEQSRQSSGARPRLPAPPAGQPKVDRVQTELGPPLA